MARDIFGKIIEKDKLVAFALSTGAIVLAKVDHVPAGIIGEPPFVLISPTQIPLPVQENGMVGGIMVIEQPKEPKLIEE
jgi:hypothetical protein